MNISWRLSSKCLNYIAFQVNVFPPVNNHNTDSVCAFLFFSFKHTLRFYLYCIIWLNFFLNAACQIIIRWKFTTIVIIVDVGTAGYCGCQRTRLNKQARYEHCLANKHTVKHITHLTFIHLIFVAMIIILLLWHYCTVPLYFQVNSIRTNVSARARAYDRERKFLMHCLQMHDQNDGAQRMSLLCA